jgi:GNAT superfamily N-acetyltransferase
VQIELVESRAQRERFVRLPWSIYRDDPVWTPPLLMERRKFINPRKHPFYQFGTAVQYLATQAGQDVGRIMVSNDPHLLQQQPEINAAFFGLFESTNDPAVTAALFNAARVWARERGRTELWGPIDYSTNYACGLLIDGFEHPPRLTMNHNPAYYERLLVGQGLVKLKDLYAWWMEPNPEIERWRPRVEKMAVRSRVTLRPLNPKRICQEIMICKEIYHQAWHDNWAFVPMTDAEYKDMAHDIVAYGKPELLLIAEIDGRPVGFSMSMPDVNEALIPLNGRIMHWGLPLGYLKFLRALRQVRVGRMLILGVLPEFRRRGIAEMLILRTFDVGMGELGYSGAELSWTLEDNELINRTIAAVGGKRYKTYRIYQQKL